MPALGYPESQGNLSLGSRPSCREAPEVTRGSTVPLSRGFEVLLGSTYVDTSLNWGPVGGGSLFRVLRARRLFGDLGRAPR